MLRIKLRTRTVDLGSPRKGEASEAENRVEAVCRIAGKQKSPEQPNRIDAAPPSVGIAEHVTSVRSVQVQCAAS